MIIDCRPIAERWLKDIQTRVTRLGRAPRLGILHIGANEGSVRFVRNKVSAAKKYGIEVLLEEHKSLDQQRAEELLKHLVAKTDGAIVQLPLPKGLDENKLLMNLPVDKDVDGLTAASEAQLRKGSNAHVPATVRGILYLLRSLDINPSGKSVCVLGVGRLVGRPAALALKNAGATVTLVDREESKPETLTSVADILVVATGQPGLVTAQFVRPDQLVLDAGFSVVEDKIQGDVLTDEVSAAGARVTPVPGGIGKLTVAALLDAVVEAALET